MEESTQPNEAAAPATAAADALAAEAGEVPANAPTPAAAVIPLIKSTQPPQAAPAMATKKSPSDEEDQSDPEAEAEAEPSDDASDAAIADTEADFDLDIHAAPMHLHALSGKPTARLRALPRPGSEGKLSTGSVDGGRRSRSASRSRAGVGRGSHASSRSTSPMPSRKSTEGNAAGDASTVGGTASHADQSVSHCSIDGAFDPDLLLDRLGFIDLDPPLPHEIRCGPLAAPGTLDGKSNNSGGLTPVNERLSEETLEDCHAFNDLVMIDNLKHVHPGGMSSTLSMPSVAHSSLSGMRSDMSVGSLSNLSVGSFKGGHSRGGSVAGGSLMGDEPSVLLGTLDEEGEDAIDEESAGAIDEESAGGEAVEVGH